MRQVLLASLAVLLTAGCQPGEQDRDALEGEWVGINYQCPIGVLHEEVVLIEKRQDTLVATKISGDDCVPAGEVTFSGTRDSITCVTGVPGGSSFSSYTGRILLESGDQFSACGVTFTRKKTSPDA